MTAYFLCAATNEQPAKPQFGRKSASNESLLAFLVGFHYNKPEVIAMETIGSRIQTLRKEKHLTQEQLAQQLHVTRQAVSNWENSKTQPDLDMLKSLSDVLGVSPEELIYGRKKPVFLPLHRKEHPMFENIGEKLKGAAVVCLWGGIILSFVLGLLLRFPLGILLGCLISLVSSWVMYGLGQVVENTNQTVEILRSVAGAVDAPIPEPIHLTPWKCRACGSYSPAKEQRCINCDTPRSYSTDQEK